MKVLRYKTSCVKLLQIDSNIQVFLVKVNKKTNFIYFYFYFIKKKIIKIKPFNNNKRNTSNGESKTTSGFLIF